MNTNNMSRIPRRCMINLRAVYDNLKTAEKKAVDYLLEYPDKVHDMTVSQFSESAGCSEATVVRLSRRLGYEGYPELKRDFASFERENIPAEYENISYGDSIIDIMKKVFESSISALQDTVNILDKDAFTRAVEYISESEKIVFSGFGDAGVVAQEAYQKFMRSGKPAFFSQDPDIQLIYASQLEPGDVLIAVSHSGRTKPLMNTVKAAKERGSRIIAITNFPVSVLTKKSDVVLQTASFSRSVSGEVISKRLTALCILESLYLNWLMTNRKDVLPVLKRSSEIVNINKTK